MTRLPNQAKTTLLVAIVAMAAIGLAAGTVAAQPQADLSANAPAEAEQGSTFQVSYTLTNSGDQDASSAGIDVDLDALPAGVTLDNIDSPDGSTAENQGAVFWTSDGPLPQGGSGTATYTFSVDSGANTQDIDINAQGDVGGNTDSTTSTVSVTQAGTGPGPSPTPSGDVSQRSEISQWGSVFLGEEDIDTTPIHGQSGDISFSGVAGAADGTFSTQPAGSVDFTSAQNFEAGGFSVPSNFGGDGDEDTTDLGVSQATISNVELVTENGATLDDGGSITQDQALTVEPEFNFGSASYVEVSLLDDSGSNLYREVFDPNDFGSNQPLGTVGQSGNAVTMNLPEANLDGGEYTVVVKSPDADDNDPRDVVGNQDTELDAEHRVSFNIRTESVTISANREEATQGEIVTATVTGTPGQTALVQIDGNDIDGDVDVANGQLDGEEDDYIYRDTSDVTALNIANNHHGAEVDLGNSGDAQVQIRTEYLDDDSTVTIEVVDGGIGSLGASEEDDVDVRINERTINIEERPNAIAIGEDFDILGTAPEIDRVGVYARLDNNYHFLGEDDSVDINDEFELDNIASSQNPLDIPGSYRVAVVDLDELEDVTGQDTPPDFNQDDYGDLDRRETFTLRTQEGMLEAELNTNTVAYDVGDEAELNGTALGANNLLTYVVGPRGQVSGVGNAPSSDWDSISVEDDDTIDAESGSIFDNRGTYTVVLIHPGRDSTFANQNMGRDLNGQLNSGRTRQNNLAIIRDVFEDAGEDDILWQENIQAENPNIGIDVIGQENQVEAGEVTITGTSNREDETNIFVEVLDQQGDSVSTADAEVDGRSSTWETTVDLSDLSDGEYLVRADDAEVTAESTISIGDVSTPTETPEPDTPTEEPDTPTEEPDTPTEEPDTPTEATGPTTPEPTPTPEAPGLGIVVGIMALLGAALLGARRRTN